MKMEEVKTINEQELSSIECLLGLDDDNFYSEKTQKIEIERLSKATGKPFIIAIKNLPVDRIYALQSNAMTKSGTVHLGNFYKGALTACSEAIIEPNFDDARLKKKLRLHEKALKIDVLQKVFKPTEINFINNQILEISGFNSNLNDELKNA